MTHTSLADVDVGSIQRLHRLAYFNGWDEIMDDAEDAMREHTRPTGANRGP